MRKLTFAFLLAAAFAVAAQDAYLVKDINTSEAESPLSSSPSNFFRFGSKIFFSAGTSAYGLELFVTDGTAAGTSMVKDITPSGSSSPGLFTDVNGTLVFNARDARGEELWTSDGTAEGTRLLADISGSGSSRPGSRIVFGGKMLFSACETVYGCELWITDGTSAGTRFFKDLAAGATSSNPRSFILLGNTIYFAADDGLWKSDGTEAGTVRVREIAGAMNLTVAGSRIFFIGSDAQAGAEPWVSDGTAAGTHRIADVRPGTAGSLLYSTFWAFGDRVIFIALDDDHGSEPWISDGTEAGTHLLLDINPGTNESVPFNFAVAVLGDRAMFAAHGAEPGYDVWVTDGTSAGTTLLRDFSAPASAGSFMLTAGDRVYFAAGDATAASIWATDGTPAGTRVVYQGEPGFTIRTPIAFIDGKLYFSAANRLNGFEPWTSDGTAAGTAMLKNLNEDEAPSSDPANFHVAGDTLFFTAWDGLRVNGNLHRPLWRTDGTPEGTFELGDRIPGYDFTYAIGSRLYFIGDDGRLWTTDGTPGSVQPATEFENRFPGTPLLSLILGDTILMNVSQRLYATTTAFGAPAVDLGVDDVTYAIGELAGRALFFTDSTDPVLWITDGTPAGTHVVRSLKDRVASGFASMGGHAYFVLYDDDTYKNTLWRTDGTPEGTFAVKEVPGYYTPVVAGKHVFFLSEDNGKLWVSDGTADGTRELPASVYGELAAIGGVITFLSTTPANGTEPWVSDGTPEGTHIITDITPGGFGYARSMTAAGTVAYFTAETKNEGTELWMTDGTPAGTRLVRDIEPGEGSGGPYDFIRAGERMYFIARPRATGSELWTVTLPATPRIHMRDVRVSESGVAHFTATLHAPSAQTVTVQYATSDGTASAGSDYDAATGTLTFAPGETAKSFDVALRTDSAPEGNETFLVTLSNAAGASIETPVAAAILEDDDRVADVALVADYTGWSSVIVDVKNLGPGIATNIDVTMTAVPVNYEPSDCWECRTAQLAPNESMRALAYGEGFKQQYLTATVHALERDPDLSNNVLAWTTTTLLAMDALHLTPGASANVWIRLEQIAGTYTITSSDPNVVSVPASTTTHSFVVHGVQPGRATITVSQGAQTIGTIDVDVLAAGAKMRYPNAFELYPKAYHVPFSSRNAVEAYVFGSAPFTGARPTGTLRIVTNDVELTRVTLRGDGARIAPEFYLPTRGTHVVTAIYDGDENFLPRTWSWTFESTPGFVGISGTATRYDDGVLVRVRVTGSPAAAPTGTIVVNDVQAPLTPIGPGLSEAELTVPDPGTATLLIKYFGNGNYMPDGQIVPVTGARRRSARH